MKNKRQKYLLLVFIILLIVTAFILFTGREKDLVAPERVQLPIREVEIDFNFLQLLQQLRFTSFSEIPEFVEEAGREDPFLRNEEDI